MAIAKVQAQTFNAKVNVNTVIALSRYDVMKADIEKRLEEVAMDNPDHRRGPATQLANRLVIRGSILTFGDEMEISETGHVTVYPREIFDKYSKRTIEMPCQIAGNVTKQFLETLDRMPSEEAASYKRKQKALTTRFTLTPIMELVKAL